MNILSDFFADKIWDKLSDEYGFKPGMNAEGDCNVYFPTFYPNGDYHMFVTTDWKYGIFGHPWRKEIVIMGAELINKFDQNENFCYKDKLLISYLL